MMHLQNLLNEGWDSYTPSLPPSNVFLEQYADFIEEDEMQTLREQLAALQLTIGKYDLRMKDCFNQSTDKRYKDIVAQLRFQLHQFKVVVSNLKLETYGR